MSVNQNIIERPKMFKLSDIPNKKIIETYPGNGRKILTPNGYKEILEVHKTVKLDKFRIELDNGLTLEAAANHIIISSSGDEIYIKDSLNVNIKTELGISKVIIVQDLKTKEHMYDISIDSSDELFYSNGILSHNSGKSVTVGIYLCWLAIFEKDVNIGIAAQTGAMAKEFLTKVKDIFIELPIWLTPGVKVWNMTSISLENGVRILSDSASSNAFRGHTCLRGDTEIEILENNIEKKVTLNELYPKIPYKNIKIKTKSGYRTFDGLKKVYEKGICIELETETINCTKSHRIQVAKGIFRQAYKLKIGNKINKQKIISIEEDDFHNYYDPLNVQGDNTYIISNINHHNCHYTVTDEAAYIKGRDNGMTKFNAYLDSMIPSQSSLAKKKNIFISTANGMNEFYSLYSGAQKEGFEEVQEILLGTDIIYSDIIENHYKSDSLEKPKEILSIEPLDKTIQKLKKYLVKYKKRKKGANGSIAFTTDWKRVPRWNQDGTLKSPEQFRSEVIASKGEVFFNQAYGNLFYGSSYTLLPVEQLKAIQTPEPVQIIDDKLKIYKKFIKGHQYVCTVDPAKDGVDGFVVNFTDITSFRLEQVATANLNIDYLLMPELLNDWCKIYGNPYLIIENNEGAGQSVADQMKITYEYDNLHYDINNNVKNVVKARKKYPGTRTTKTSRNQILKTFKTFFTNGNLIINDEETIKQLYTFILIDGKYQADNGEHDDCVMSLALVFILFTNAKNITDMKEVTKQLKQDLEAVDPVNIAEMITIGNFDCEYEDESSETYTDSAGITYTGFDNEFGTPMNDFNIEEFG